LDSLTHIAVGACIGEVFLHRKLGKKALLWGVLAQSIPDIDFIAALWLNTSENLLAHRGFTHSILFACLISIAMSLAADHWHRPHNIAFRKYVSFFTVQVFVHIILDSLNNYGIGWFEPFSHQRISFDTIFVADPFFSFTPGIAAAFLFILKNHQHPQRRLWMRIGLIIPSLYLCYTIYNKITIENDVKAAIENQHISSKNFFTTPTPFNNWLWFVVVKNDSGYFTGYRSVFDSKPMVDLTYFPRNESLLDSFLEDPDTHNLLQFARDYYTVEKWNDTLVFNDLRFGQIAGWENPKARFAFHYFINYPKDNTLVVQRGRFMGWDKQTLNSMMKRIKGD